MGIKITPFYRKTKDQTQSFYLDQLSGFTSYLNVGRQTSDGVEMSETDLDRGPY